MLARLVSAATRRPAAWRAMSTVADKSVTITFVDLEGVRKTVPGLVGQSIYEVAKLHDIALDGACGGGGMAKYIRRTDLFLEDEYGAGPQCNTCHVIIPDEWYGKLNEVFECEQEQLDDIGDNLYVPGASRLGCQVRLSKALDGMVVYIPDGPPVHEVVNTMPTR
eukprot:TRINITY_DN29800_c0_g1_i1.p1 TRINITY_DN29800_c0_g1~~TRINITY_DN29800_c0_g1_i1.p1  ORF type:complete len:181 (-),score=41.34 TRINITY_DN29800_c0_g1_i1:192-686(-)